ncbi:hypothetical protein BaRGS_00024768, partial [Batillaria attramentaria]
MVRQGKWREPADLLVAGLALTDALTGVFLLYNTSYSIVYYQHVTECLVRFGLVHVLLAVSDFLLLCLTVDRFLKIVTPYRSDCRTSQQEKLSHLTGQIVTHQNRRNCHTLQEKLSRLTGQIVTHQNRRNCHALMSDCRTSEQEKLSRPHVRLSHITTGETVTPYRYGDMCGKWTIWVVMVTAWLLGIVFGSLPTMGWNKAGQYEVVEGEPVCSYFGVMDRDFLRDVPGSGSDYNDLCMMYMLVTEVGKGGDFDVCRMYMLVTEVGKGGDFDVCMMYMLVTEVGKGGDFDVCMMYMLVTEVGKGGDFDVCMMYMLVTEVGKGGDFDVCRMYMLVTEVGKGGDFDVCRMYMLVTEVGKGGDFDVCRMYMLVTEVGKGGDFDVCRMYMLVTEVGKGGDFDVCRMYMLVKEVGKGGDFDVCRMYMLVKEVGKGGDFDVCRIYMLVTEVGKGGDFDVCRMYMLVTEVGKGGDFDVCMMYMLVTEVGKGGDFDVCRMYMLVINVPILVNAILYVKLFLVARKHAAAIAAQTGAISAARSQHAWRYTKTVLVIVGVYFACWFPMGMLVVLTVTGQLDEVDNSRKGDFLLYCSSTVFINSIANPIIYAVNIRAIKRRFQAIFCNGRVKCCGKLICQQNEE